MKDEKYAGIRAYFPPKAFSSFILHPSAFILDFMWHQFNAEARRAILEAQNQAARENSPVVSSDHLLLALLAQAPQGENADEYETVATQILRSIDIEPELLRLALQSRMQNVVGTIEGEAQLSPVALRVLEMAADEAQRLEHSPVGTEHLLLGLLRLRHHIRLSNEYYFAFILHKLRIIGDARLDEIARKMHARNDSVASQILYEFGVEVEAVRFAVRNRNARPEDSSLTAETQRIIDRAHRETWATGCGLIAPAHLWLGILGEENSLALQIVRNTGVLLPQLEKALRDGIRSDNQVRAGQPRFSPQSRNAFRRARREARRAHCRYVGGEHLLLGLLGDVERSARARQKMRLSPRGDETVAAALRDSGLWQLGFDTDFLRARVLRELGATPKIIAESETVTVKSTPEKRRTFSAGEIENRVREIVAEELKVDIARVVPAADWFKDFNCSMDVVEVFMRCEEEFEIHIPEEAELSTVGALTVFIQQQLADETRAPVSGRKVEPQKSDERSKKLNLVCFLAPIFSWLVVAMPSNVFVPQDILATFFFFPMIGGVSVPFIFLFSKSARLKAAGAFFILGLAVVSFIIWLFNLRF